MPCAGMWGGIRGKCWGKLLPVPCSPLSSPQQCTGKSTHLKGQYGMCFLLFPLFIWLSVVCYHLFPRWEAEFHPCSFNHSLPSEPNTGSNFDVLGNPLRLSHLGSLKLGDWGMKRRMGAWWPAHGGGTWKGCWDTGEGADYFCFPEGFLAEVL